MQTDSATPIALDPHSQEQLPEDLSVVAAQLIQAACTARDGDREATSAHIARAVAILRRMPHIGPSAGRLAAWQTRKVLAHVEENLSRRIRIQELAQLLRLSASHFCRAFKCTLGASPRDYVLRRRIEMAQQLMLTTSEPLASIAIRCGMCDQQHFTRCFRRLVGATPYTWRRNRQDGLIRA
jgi:AraC family transcriptional regulator